MRRIVLMAMLAGVAAPALAEPAEGRDGRARFRAERAEKADRPERAERAERRERAEARSERNESDMPRLQRTHERVRERNSDQVDANAPAAPVVSRRAGDSVREWRMGERRRDDSPASIEERNLREAPSLGGGDGLVEPTRALPRVFDPQRRRISRTPQFGTEPPPRSTTVARHSEPARRWRTDWRRDHRYDWRDWRRRHHSRFRLGFYFDPFGWGYHRYSVGWRLWPQYYRSSYWLNDPWQYRLPPAYGPYRWVRYHDDALLVNIYTGEVVDVIYDFFW